MSSETSAVLLLAHGSPDTVDEIPEFLRYVTGGRPLPETVIQEIKHRFGLIGCSPLTCHTMSQAELVKRELSIPIYIGMRNWKPFIADAVKQMSADGITRAVAICLAPQNSRTSVGLYRKALVRDAGTTPFSVDFVEAWHDHPLLVRAFAEKFRPGWQRACREAGTQVPVIFTAHSVPQRTIADGDPYEAQTRETAKLVAEEVNLGPGDWSFAFQSQGMAGGPWIGPTVEDTIIALKEKGHNAVFLQPIGFVCDHVEILYDIDIAFRKFAEDRGLRLWRAESLNDSATFAAAVADVAKKRLRLSATATLA